MAADSLLLFMVLALLAEILGTLGGFGSSVFFIPIAGYFLEFHQVLGVTALFHVSSNLAKIALFKQGIDKKIVINLGIPAVVFVIIGAYLTQFLDAQKLELSFAVFLIVISSLLLYYKDFSLQPTITNTVSGGVLSGFIAGLLGTGGAIRGMVLAAYNLKPEIFITTSAMIDLGIDFSRSIVYFFNGFIQKDILYLIPILLVISVLGTYIGKIILKRISENQFKYFVLVLVLITGVSTLIKSFYN